jgi:hypothetical protein
MPNLITQDRPPSLPEAAVLAHQYHFLAPGEVDAFNSPCTSILVTAGCSWPWRWGRLTWMPF